MGQCESVHYIYAIPTSFDSDGAVIYRNPDAVNGLVEDLNREVPSIYGLFCRSRNAFKEYKCLGTKTKVGEAYAYTWRTYDEVYYDTQQLAAAILKQNLATEVLDQDFDVKLKLLGICSVNRREWITTDLACNLIGVTSVPLYETLGQQMLKLILKQTEMTTLFGNDKSLVNIVKMAFEEKDPEIKLKQIVLFDENPSHNLIELCREHSLKVLSFSKLVKDSRVEQFLDPKVQNKLTDIFTISYTSGTEKNSKGVMLSNRNFLSAITNIQKVGQGFEVSVDDVYLSYLPLAHVFDRLGVYSAISVGGKIGFYGGDVLKLGDDMLLLKPSVFPTVPRLLNKIYDKILIGLEQQSSLKKWMYHKGIGAKRYYLDKAGLIDHDFYDTIMFNKAKTRLGGHVRLIITASAPIADNILSTLKCLFCCPIVEAYGQTESCGASFATMLYDNKAGHVGGPAVGIEYKLRDVEDLGYTRLSQPFPKGEVCIRGPSLFHGYFKNRALTEEVLDRDGWLHTGDVGMVQGGNSLKIVDRIKNIFKLSQGEYIVSEKLERVYEQSIYIQMIFIYGDSLKNHIVAIIFPEIDTIQPFCRQRNLPSASMHDMIKHDAVKDLIQGDMERLATENKLNGLEKVKKFFRLVDQPFQIGTVLTPTLKLRRAQARDTYQDLIDDIYAEGE